MANALDEMNNENVLPQGHDVNVIAKQIPVKVGAGSKFFEIILWVLGIIPGLVFLIMKMQANNYFRGLEQKIQANASTIDNCLESRVVILKNCAKLLDKAIDLDKETFTKIAEYRGGKGSDADVKRNEYAQQVDSIEKSINVAFENYPDLKAHQEIADAMQQNAYLQKEIAAARELYNDTVFAWNRDIFAWPTKMIVAAKNGYTSRIPFATTSEMKEAARGEFF